MSVVPRVSSRQNDPNHRVAVSDLEDGKRPDGNSGAGDHIDLRFEMNCLVALSCCQHPLDKESKYNPRAIDLVAWRSGVAGPDDPCRNACAENQRAFINTERLYA